MNISFFLLKIDNLIILGTLNMLCLKDYPHSLKYMKSRRLPKSQFPNSSANWEKIESTA